MIRQIEALNFRCLRYVRQPLGPFHVLVGPNASGKTTFLDAVSFLGRMVSDGLDAAIHERTVNFQDLVWGREKHWFELAIEAAIPEERRKNLKKDFDTIRYEVRIGQLAAAEEIGIIQERALLKQWVKPLRSERLLFPMEAQQPASILGGKFKAGARTVLSKQPGGNDNFYSELVEKEKGHKGWYPSVRLGPRKSALANLHEDESRFPVCTWLKQFLAQGVQSFVLNSQVIRKASPPGQTLRFKPDGSNLPWVINELRQDEVRFREWIRHVRSALPDIEDVQTVLLDDIRHRYLKVCYRGGLEVPSWVASDGTLRLLALTLPAYLRRLTGVYLIEEPENGIHPGAVETAFQSLSSVYDAQVLLATHSPVILSMAGADKVLCFKKTESGATDIVLGSEHPQLKDWKGQPNLSVLFASGVLG